MSSTLNDVKAKAAETYQDVSGKVVDAISGCPFAYLW